MSSITVHVAYEFDAAPFTGAFPDGSQYWSVLENDYMRSSSAASSNLSSLSPGILPRK
ncbi:MAG: hypothetical protein MZV70_57325 [Desulfobacterales bacterium]|nr:hypothetical protein [Desulfobacterales bacterium]